MKKPLDVLQAEFAEKKQAAVTLYETTLRAADADGNRTMTAEERAKVQALNAEALAIQKLIAEQTQDRDLLVELDRLTSGVAPLPPRRMKSLGEQFVTAPEYHQFFKVQQGHRTQSSWRSPSFELQAATLTEDPASGGALVQPQYLPGIRPTETRRVVVADLFAPGTTDSNAVSYMQETTFTNAAAAVAEGAAKPESTLIFAGVTDPVRKIAHWLPVSEEMLEDAAQIRSYIDARLRLGVQLEEEDQLLNGDGIAPNILGVRNRPGLHADVAMVAGETNADVLLRLALDIFATSFLMPDGFVLNPADWAATILTKNDAGDYYTGGPFSPIQVPTLWGLAVAVTPVQPAGIGLTGAFKTGGQVFRRGGIRVEASNSHADFFIKNLVAIRAEERLALAIYRPAAFGEATGLSPVGPATAGARSGRREAQA